MSDWSMFRDRRKDPRDRPTLGSAIVTALANGPLKTPQLLAAIGDTNAHTLRSTLARMAGVGMLDRSVETVKGRPVITWSLGAVPYTERAPVPRVQIKEEPWAPGKWVHPHLLKQQRRPEPEPLPLDFADPRRRVA